MNTPERSRAYDLDVTSQADTQPASYTRLVGAEATKLGSSEAHWYSIWTDNIKVVGSGVLKVADTDLQIRRGGLKKRFWGP